MEIIIYNCEIVQEYMPNQSKGVTYNLVGPLRMIPQNNRHAKRMFQSFLTSAECITQKTKIRFIVQVQIEPP